MKTATFRVIINIHGSIVSVGNALNDFCYTYDADNRLVTYNGEEVTYDADGNMLHGPLDGQMADFTYDCRNRLIGVVTADGEVTSYEYDAENIRLSVITDRDKRVYVTDPEATYSQLLEEHIYEKNALGIYTERAGKTYTYGVGLLSERRNAGGQTADQSGETLYYHFDNIGSATEMTDAGGTLRYRFAYGAYGEILDIEDGNGASLIDVQLTSNSTTLHTALLQACSAALKETDIRFLYNGELGVQTETNGLYYMLAVL